MNIGRIVTSDDDGFDADWASKPDANVVADDAEQWLHDLTMNTRVPAIARAVVVSSRHPMS